MFNKFRGYTRAFETANIVELLERGAYYGVFVAITLYLSKMLVFNNVKLTQMSSVFSECLYLLPIFAEVYTDKIGFK